MRIYLAVLALVLSFSLPANAQLTAQELKPTIPVTKHYFVGGGGVKHLGQQLVFPVKHPMKFGNNLSHPFRHPLVAFRQFSDWAGPYNNGMQFAASAASIAGSAALQTLWTNKFRP